MKGKGLVAIVEFDVAHFKVHTTMKGRTTYLIPLPSTVIGLFFSILGLSREEYLRTRDNFLAGAQILELKGISRENAQLLKLKPSKEARTTEELMILFHPIYKFAIWGDKDVIEKLSQKIEKYEFTYVPYGGISDFIFWDIREPTIIEKYEVSERLTNSYAPYEIVESPSLDENGMIYSLPYLSKGEIKRVIMTYNTSLYLNSEIPTLEGVPLYRIPLEVIKT